jgi:hypothetical protein
LKLWDVRVAPLDVTENVWINQVAISSNSKYAAIVRQKNVEILTLPKLASKPILKQEAESTVCWFCFWKFFLVFDF